MRHWVTSADSGVSKPRACAPGGGAFIGEQLVATADAASTELVRRTQALTLGHQINNEMVFLCAASDRAREMIPLSIST
jgi:hypothetical protein